MDFSINCDKDILHIGVTPTNGADTPAYSPYSFAFSHLFAICCLENPKRYPCQPFPGNGPPHHINCSRVDPFLCCLQPHFDQIKRVPDHDGTNATDASCN